MEEKYQPKGKTAGILVDEFLEYFRGYAERVSKAHYPHQNRWLALLHQFADAVALLTRKRMEADDHAPVCREGCDACCFFADVSASRVEFEALLTYLNSPAGKGTRKHLLRQWSHDTDEKHISLQSCPFLIRKTGSCGVYPVRPIGCRLALSSQTCGLEAEHQGEFEVCTKLTRIGWQEMPLRPDMLLTALNNLNAGKKFFKPGSLDPDAKVDFKDFTSQELIDLFDLQDPVAS